ncbi:MAG: hypothetical protein GW948_02210 [Rhodobacterales bacterium]|nr:hypothetical protein [Rhodobacterales bacterium]
MFKINARPTFTIEVPIALEGATDTQTLKATFRAIPDEEATAHDFNSAEGFKTFLRDVIVELHDLVDLEDKPLAYSVAVRDELLGWQHIRMALYRAYWAALSKGRSGN